MQFISQGSALVTSNLNLARKRMFLMTSDIARPKVSDGIASLMSKIDKARSFSHSKQQDGTLLCTRAAGWKNNQYFHTLVGPLRASWPQELSGSATNYLNMPTTSYSVLDTFRRMYSIGAKDAASVKFIDYAGSLHDTADVAYEADTSILHFPTMFLPAFEGQVDDGNVYSVADSASTNVTASNGSIGTVGRYENRSANYVQTWARTAVNQDSQSYAGGTTALSNYAAGNEIQVVGQSLAVTSAARIVYAHAWSSYGSYYFSGGGWNYSYTRSQLYNIVASREDARMYSKGTGQTDTADYAFDWAMMPVSLPDGQVIVQIADFVSDLIQTGQCSVAVRPQVKSNITDLPNKQQVFSI